jgi:hypothetical protein
MGGVHRNQIEKQKQKKRKSISYLFLSLSFSAIFPSEIRPGDAHLGHRQICQQYHCVGDGKLALGRLWEGRNITAACAKRISAAVMREAARAMTSKRVDADWVGHGCRPWIVPFGSWYDPHPVGADRVDISLSARTARTMMTRARLNLLLPTMHREQHLDECWHLPSVLPNISANVGSAKPSTTDQIASCSSKASR